MTGLVLKDFLMMRKTLKTYVLFFVLYFGMSIAGIFPISVATSMVTMIIAVLPISTFSFDEMAKWDRYAVSLPLGRREVVGARYLFILLLLLVSAAAGLLSVVLTSLMGKEEMAEMLATLLVTITYGLILNGIMTPLVYKMGPERARTYLYIIVFAPMILFFLAARLELMDLSGLKSVPEEVVMLICYLLPVAGLAGLGLSYLVSCRIYEKKEF